MENKSGQDFKSGIIDKILDWIENHEFLSYVIAFFIAIFLAGLMASIFIFIAMLVTVYLL